MSAMGTLEPIAMHKTSVCFGETVLGKALYYLNGQWDKLIRYLEDARLEIDNNLVDNAVRPFALGRTGCSQPLFKAPRPAPIYTAC